MSAAFAERVLRWFDEHGRKNLPWQHPRTPFRAWVAEIMLQQTQVAVVTPYFERFMKRFPDLHALAASPVDEVFALWSGLGYYARARNLHRCAKTVVAEHGGEFPMNAESMQALPGIGKSTANAILAQCHGQRLPILDGNVRRVLARHAGIEGEPQRAATQRALWAQSEMVLPDERLADYTQAIMDIGATICRARDPKCGQCPVAADCVALATGRVAELPTRRTARRARPQRTWYAAVTVDGERFCFERRPPQGIWSQLWCFPLSDEAPAGQALAPIEHSFSHFDLTLVPVLVASQAAGVSDASTAWLTIDEASERGLPQPVRRLLATLDDHMRQP